MFGLRERPYPGRVLKRFWFDSDSKNFDFLRFIILADISVLLIFDIIKIWQSSHTSLLGLFLIISSMHIDPGNMPCKFFFFVFQLFQQNPRWPPKSYVAL